MKGQKIVREVVRTKIDGKDGYVIMSPDGEIQAFYPAKIRPADPPFENYTAEISTEFFAYIAMLQSSGTKVIFRL